MMKVVVALVPIQCLALGTVPFLPSGHHRNQKNKAITEATNQAGQLVLAVCRGRAQATRCAPITVAESIARVVLSVRFVLHLLSCLPPVLSWAEFV